MYIALKVAFLPQAFAYLIADYYVCIGFIDGQGTLFRITGIYDKRNDIANVKKVRNPTPTHLGSQRTFGMAKILSGAMRYV